MRKDVSTGFFLEPCSGNCSGSFNPPQNSAQVLELCAQHLAQFDMVNLPTAWGHPVLRPAAPAPSCACGVCDAARLQCLARRSADPSDACARELGCRAAGRFGIDCCRYRCPFLIDFKNQESLPLKKQQVNGGRWQGGTKPIPLLFSRRTLPHTAPKTCIILDPGLGRIEPEAP